ncbi:hypothetical protein DFH08DRAFT_1077733 [Mycena albidolilacea]|uniref:Uncharacterized protein n=1 Tax=Mycena albidolilacea TaxID=1033008 RepID=A0AAD7AAW5_9AGAR|nr:hypothetical protein DFH08DRAFT_1077733 [Mycena albidolilacea]
MPHPTGVGYCIFEGTTNLAVTSWKALTSPVAFTRNTPLTLQIFDPKEPQQIFNFTSATGV